MLCDGGIEELGDYFGTVGHRSCRFAFGTQLENALTPAVGHRKHLIEDCTQ